MAEQRPTARHSSTLRRAAVALLAALGTTAGAPWAGTDAGAHPATPSLSRVAAVAPAITGQLIVVSAPAYGDTYATLTAYDVTPTGRRAVYGPWTARIGANGFAPPGRKREGDGRTPSGEFG